MSPTARPFRPNPVRLYEHMCDGWDREVVTCNEDFVVLVDEIEASVVWHKGRNLLAVLDQLNPSTLANRRIWLFCFDPTEITRT